MIGETDRAAKKVVSYQTIGLKWRKRPSDTQGRVSQKCLGKLSATERNEPSDQNEKEGDEMNATEETIQEKLNELSVSRSMRDATIAEMENLVQSIIPEEIRQKISDIKTEFSEKLEGLGKNIETLEKDISGAVVMRGASVKGALLHAVYTDGRMTWDNKGLYAYTKDHPEIKKFMKIGEPYVTIRKAA